MTHGSGILSRRLADEQLDADLIVAAPHNEQQRRVWLAARRAGLGASDSAAVLGVDPYRTPLAVWLDKVSDEPPDSASPSRAAWHGSAFEDVVARMWASEHPEIGKLAPSPGLLGSRSHSWMYATPDRLVVQRRASKPRVLGLLEVKTTSEHAFREHWVDGQPPTRVQVQVQQQLAVTGLQRCHVAVLVGGIIDERLITIERDERVIDQIVDLCGSWWRKYVVEREMPDVSLASRDDLSRMFPGDLDAEPVWADEQTRALVDELRHVKHVKREAEQRQDDIARDLLALLGDRTAIVDDDGQTLVTYRPQITRRVDLTELRRRVPRDVELSTHEKTSRVLRVKEASADA